MMKVSKRDLFALIVLLVVGVSFLLYTYLYKPLLDDIAKARNTLEEKESLKAYFSLMVSSDEIEKYEKEVADKLSAAEEANASLLPDLKKTKIIHFFDNVASSCGVTLESVFFSDDGLFDTTPAASSSSGESYLVGELADRIKGGAGEKPGAPSRPSADKPVARQTFVDLTFAAESYEQLTEFLRGVESANRSIYFESLSLRKDYYTIEVETGETDENGEPVTESQQRWRIDVTARYSLVAIDKLSDADAGLEEVDPSESTGAPDPFAG